MPRPKPVQRNVGFAILRSAAEINDLAHPHFFAGTEAEMPDREQREEQVRRILRSATFRNASTLQQLLTYLASKSAAGTGETPKEYTIGLEALGRKEDFDPKIDPIVRVQSHRLRTKLREYYAVEGSQDPILIQIPKGHYLPTFELMPAGSPILAEIPDLHEAGAGVPVPDEAIKPEAEKDTRVGSPASRTGWSTATQMVAAVFCLLICFLGFGIGRLYSSINSIGEASTGRKDTTDKEVVQNFWARFLNDDRSPVIAYPDAIFLLDDSNDLFRYRRGASDGRGGMVEPHLARQFASNPQLVEKAGQLYYENGYTGTGELEAVAMLSGLLGRMGIKPIIKSSRDLTPDDLNQHNVILLGSPFQNVAVAQLLTSGDFVFQNPDQRHEQWRAQILNAHPRPGESATYGTERDPDTRVLASDYSLITIVPGVVQGRYIADLGGLDTKGTQGATMFATSSFGVEQLTHALVANNALPASGPPIFQALVRVQLAKGYQVLGAELTTLHPIPEAKTQRPKAGAVAERH
jgi:hypothetical protein